MLNWQYNSIVSFFMSEGGIEGFSPSEQNEGIDAAALELLREQMKAAHAQMKKDQAQEKKQKDQEESLFEILFLLLKKLGQNDPRIQLIVACLAKNFTAHTILTILSLEFKTVAKLINISFLIENSSLAEAQENSLIIKQLGHKDLEIYQRYNLDLWLKSINASIFSRASKSLHAMNDSYDGQYGLDVLKNIINFIAKDYLIRERAEFTETHLKHFVDLFINNLFERLQKQVAGANPEPNKVENTEEL